MYTFKRDILCISSLSKELTGHNWKGWTWGLDEIDDWDNVIENRKSICMCVYKRGVCLINVTMRFKIIKRDDEIWIIKNIVAINIIIGGYKITKSIIFVHQLQIDRWNLCLFRWNRHFVRKMINRIIICNNKMVVWFCFFFLGSVIIIWKRVIYQ